MFPSNLSFEPLLHLEPSAELLLSRQVKSYEFLSNGEVSIDSMDDSEQYKFTLVRSQHIHTQTHAHRPSHHNTQNKDNHSTEYGQLMRLSLHFVNYCVNSKWSYQVTMHVYIWGEPERAPH